jgi:hypothetical protein
MRNLGVLFAAALLTSCAASERDLYPVRDLEGRVIRPDPDSCMASLAARRYIYEMREKLLSIWEPPTEQREEITVLLRIRIAESGYLKEVYAEAPDDPLQASAVAALERAAPFPRVPAEAICLTEEPFLAKFIVGPR